MPAAAALGQAVRIAIVGDVHEYWDATIDKIALRSLKVDLALFVGDFADEDPKWVKMLSVLTEPKAVILGNHDSWWTTGPFRGNRRGIPDGVQPQLDSLGDEHVGFSRRDFSALSLSVVGGRPFSTGGPILEVGARPLYKQRYGITSLEESSERIVENAMAAPSDHTLVLMAHNGPSGLGTSPDDLCGRDWEDHGGPPGGDWGDPDFASAVAAIKSSGRQVPLVVFGHMHRQLCISGQRKMLKAAPDGTVYLNSAVVPRVRPIGWSQGEFEGPIGADDDCWQAGSERNFTLVTMVNGEVALVEETWVRVSADEKCEVAEVIEWYRSGSQ